MTEATASTPSPELAGPADGGDPRHAAAVLGMVAYLELASFSRLAADAGLAPTLRQRLELSDMARRALDRVDRVAARVEELGGQLEPTMGPFAGVLAEFDSRTVPSTWWERLLKGYVGYGVADDFCRILAGSVDASTRALVEEVLDDESHSRFVVEALAEAAQGDPTLASRLALWGRRLVGEALNAAQRVLADHPTMAELLDVALPEHQGDAQQRLFSLLTADHSRRMDRLKLAA
jgi:hypothetical protein